MNCRRSQLQHLLHRVQLKAPAGALIPASWLRVGYALLRSILKYFEVFWSGSEMTVMIVRWCVADADFLWSSFNAWFNGFRLGMSRHLFLKISKWKRQSQMCLSLHVRHCKTLAERPSLWKECSLSAGVRGESFDVAVAIETTEFQKSHYYNHESQPLG